MSEALRKLATSIGKSKTIVIFINQIREKVGMIFGNPETTSGGRSLRFYAAMRIKVSRRKISEDKSSYTILAQIVKNKVAPPFKETLIDLSYTKGFDFAGDVIKLAVKKGIIVQAGTWYTYKKITAQGVDKLKEKLTTCIPNLIKELRQ